MARRQVFFSFEYDKDCWRASQVRSMGVVDSSSTFCESVWKEQRDKSDYEIQKWIDSQLSSCSCLVVLVGETTAERKWVNYEIKKAYELNKGIVGVYIHGMLDKDGNQSEQGDNPFKRVFVGPRRDQLSKFVSCYDSPYITSAGVCNDIQDKLPALIERAITNKDMY